MPKLICCCGATGATGFYVAIPCEEFESDRITEIGENDLFPTTIFPTVVCNASNNPKMPFAKIVCKPISAIRNHTHLFVVTPINKIPNNAPTIKNDQKK